MLAMQKVEGSSPFSRFQKSPLRRGFLLPECPFWKRRRRVSGAWFRIRSGNHPRGCRFARSRIGARILERMLSGFWRVTFRVGKAGWPGPFGKRSRCSISRLPSAGTIGTFRSPASDLVDSARPVASGNGHAQAVSTGRMPIAERGPLDRVAESQRAVLPRDADCANRDLAVSRRPLHSGMISKRRPPLGPVPGPTRAPLVRPLPGPGKSEAFETPGAGGI